MNVIIKTAELDGKRIAYTNETEFYVQVGRYSNVYSTRRKIVGDLGQAVLAYTAINIGLGYKKRLVAPTLRPRLIARYISSRY